MQSLSPQRIQASTNYILTCLSQDGKLLGEKRYHNRVVTQMLDHYLDAAVKTGAAAPTWYVGLIGANITDAAITTGLSTLSSLSAPWVAADQGREIIVKGAGAGADLVTTITTVTDASNVVLAASAGATVSGAEAAWEARLGDTPSSHAPWTEVVAYSEATRPLFVPGVIANGAVDNSASKALFTMNATANIFGSFLIDSPVKNGVVGTLYGMGVFTSSSQPVVNTNQLQIQANLSLTAV